MRIRLFIALILATGCVDASPSRDQRLVDRAKATDVSDLDTSLASQRLEDWLHTIVREDRSLRWSPADCGVPPRGDRCVRLDVGGAGLNATAVIQVGRDPRLRLLEVPPFVTESTRLSVLPELLARAEKTVAYAKGLDVRTLDPTLPSRPLEEWLRRGPLGLRDIKWRLSDCSMKPIGRDRDRYPLCVDFVFDQDKVGGVGMIRVGTLGGGLVQPASVVHVLLNVKQRGETESAVASSLGKLPLLVLKYR